MTHHLFHLQKITKKQEVEKKYNARCASLQPWPPVKTDEMTIGKQSAQQYKHLRKYNRKDLKEMIHEQFENSGFILYPKEGLPPDDSRRATYMKVIPPCWKVHYLL